jgi:predicted DNA-binding transcriptional regulator AlpA
MSNEQLLTLAEAAQVLGLKPATLRAWRLRRKHIPFVELSPRAVRVRWSDIQALIDRRVIPARPEARR